MDGMASDGDDLTSGNPATPPNYRSDYGDGLDEPSGEWTTGGGASGYGGRYGETSQGTARAERLPAPREPIGGGRREIEDGRSARRSGGSGRKPMPLWQELPLLLLVAFCLAVLIRTSCSRRSSSRRPRWTR